LKETAGGQFETLESIWEDAFSGWRRYCKKKLWYGKCNCTTTWQLFCKNQYICSCKAVMIPVSFKLAVVI